LCQRLEKKYGDPPRKPKREEVEEFMKMRTMKDGKELTSGRED
jgi:hypothetical protein